MQSKLQPENLFCAYPISSSADEKGVVFFRPWTDLVTSSTSASRPAKLLLDLTLPENARSHRIQDLQQQRVFHFVCSASGLDACSRRDLPQPPESARASRRVANRRDIYRLIAIHSATSRATSGRSPLQQHLGALSPCGSIVSERITSIEGTRRQQRSSIYIQTHETPVHDIRGTTRTRRR
ncbi:hypothetical protein N7510_009318 [Penicillium lagena]|uniref:uncharacterized protein n=1 Tax=Penicillium lagena TaxID=94218 RepID=UPI00253F6CD3|nr:uncharacterized protein N7510_009318 [Penicillium lagena]KAJ5606537.1 hypothetical protein N7510_009318 [Penicillium lagena]